MIITSSATFTPDELSAMRAMDALSDVLTALNAAGCDPHSGDNVAESYFSTWQHQGPKDNPGRYGQAWNLLESMLSEFCEVTGLRMAQPAYGPALDDPRAALVNEIMNVSLDQQAGCRISAALMYVTRYGIAVTN